MCPRCSAPLNTRNLDEEVEGECWRCGYVKYTPVREGWFDGDEIFTGATKPRRVDLPQTAAFGKNSAIHFNFTDENGHQQMMVLGKVNAKCSCDSPRNSNDVCKHEKWAKDFLAKR